MPVEIRCLKPGEAAVLDRVGREVFDDDIVAAAARAFVDDPLHHIAVAIDQGVVVGFVTAVRYFHPDKPDPELWINEVGVGETHRRRGLAKALMAAVFSAGRAAGCKEAWVLTEAGNGPAVALYESLGPSRPAEPCVMFSFDL
jgi:ribosomal protein S18 acetylase RimI-like enzyme